MVTMVIKMMVMLMMVMLMMVTMMVLLFTFRSNACKSTCW